MSIGDTNIAILEVLYSSLGVRQGGETVHSGVQKAAIGIGAHGFVGTRKALKKAGIGTISANEIDALDSHVGTPVYAELNRDVLRKLFHHYGYSSYEQLDIDPTADIVFNLNAPLPDELEEKYDLVFDPTSNYVTDVIGSLEKTSKMLKIGGYKIVVSSLGDHTNRYELNPSANFLIDFHEARGFSVETAFIMNAKQRTLPYRRYKTKITRLPTLLPVHSMLLYFAKSLIHVGLRERLSVLGGEYTDYTAPYQQHSDTPHNPTTEATSEAAATPPLSTPVGSGRSGLHTMMKRVVKGLWGEQALRRGRAYKTRLDRWISLQYNADWTAVIILKKNASVESSKFHVTGHYRSFSEE